MSGGNPVNPLEELIANARQLNKKRIRPDKDYRDDDDLLALVRQEDFREKMEAAGYESINEDAFFALDRILKERLVEFIKRSLVNCDCRNGGMQLTKKDAIDVVKQTNYFKRRTQAKITKE